MVTSQGWIDHMAEACVTCGHSRGEHRCVSGDLYGACVHLDGCDHHCEKFVPPPDPPADDPGTAIG